MQRFGVSTAMLTPFLPSGEIDTDRLCQHALGVLKGGADSVTLFGTTGEGASIGFDERVGAVEALLAAGCPAEKIVLGVAANAVSDAASQVAQGRGLGVASYLLLPPFYFKGLSEAGLYEWHSELFQRTDPEAKFILYHIPQVSGVGLPVEFVGRMANEHRSRVQAIKDSSGSWENAQSLLALNSVEVLVGDERLLHKAMANGAAGSINGMSNLYPDRMKRIVETAQEDPALSEEVGRIVSVPVVAALKTVIAARTGEPGWERVRGPLSPLNAEDRALVLGTAASAA